MRELLDGRTERLQNRGRKERTNVQLAAQKVEHDKAGKKEEE